MKVLVTGGSGRIGEFVVSELQEKKYEVTVFDKLPVAGGMMAVGIPEYRLPRDVLQAEIQVIRDMGVEIKTGVAFGEDITLQGLKDEGYKAFFIATGLHLSRKLYVDGEDLPNVLQGVDFLRSVSLGDPVQIGGPVT